MTLDFQQVRQQIKQLGENAQARAQDVRKQRESAKEQLEKNLDLEELRQKVRRIVRLHDPNLRCALPSSLEVPPVPLSSHFALPSLPGEATILAADGSQIPPDRHAAVNYCLVNVGAIQMQLGQPTAPVINISSQLFYDEQLYTLSGTITDERVALMRDLAERKRLAELAEFCDAPVITFTDGPMELWGGREGEGDPSFKESLAAYQQTLHRLFALQAITAGYVDKPAANLVVRLLEISLLDEGRLADIKKHHPLRNVIDRDLFLVFLAPGERSAVFAIQSRSGTHYSGEMALHFFYLNVGRENHPHLARVEIPAWVAQEPSLLDGLHSVLVHQCRILGSRPYPYLLHRAHEAAVVTLQEKEQVSQMIAGELRSRGIEPGENSYKQDLKDLAGKTSYK